MFYYFAQEASDRKARLGREERFEEPFGGEVPASSAAASPTPPPGGFLRGREGDGYGYSPQPPPKRERPGREQRYEETTVPPYAASPTPPQGDFLRGREGDGYGYSPQPPPKRERLGREQRFDEKMDREVVPEEVTGPSDHEAPLDVSVPSTPAALKAAAPDSQAASSPLLGLSPPPPSASPSPSSPSSPSSPPPLLFDSLLPTSAKAQLRRHLAREDRVRALERRCADLAGTVERLELGRTREEGGEEQQREEKEEEHNQGHNQGHDQRQRHGRRHHQSPNQKSPSPYRQVPPPHHTAATFNSLSATAHPGDSVSPAGALVLSRSHRPKSSNPKSSSSSSSPAPIAAASLPNAHKCFACDVVSKLVEQNDHLRSALALALGDKKSRLDALGEAKGKLEFEGEEGAAARAQMRGMGEMLERGERQLAEKRSLEEGKESEERRKGEEKTEKDQAEIKHLKGQLLEQLEANRELVKDNAGLHDKQEHLKKSVAAMKAMKISMRALPIAPPTPTAKPPTASTTDTTETGVNTDVSYSGENGAASNTAEAESGLDAEGERILGEAMLAARAAGGEGVLAKDKSTETVPDGRALCEKCDGLNPKVGDGLNPKVGDGLNPKVGVPSKPAVGKVQKGSKSPKGTKARVILEAKVMQTMYEILEKKILQEESDANREKKAPPPPASVSPKQGGRRRGLSTPKGGARRAATVAAAAPSSFFKTGDGMIVFLKMYFNNKYGISGNLAEQQLANFLSSLKVYKAHNTRIQHFLTLCGHLNEEVFCPAIEEAYLGTIRAVMGYKNYEGTSELLDDGIGEVNMTKRMAAFALLGRDGTISAQGSWKCEALVKIVGVAGVRKFYEVAIARKLRNTWSPSASRRSSSAPSTPTASASNSSDSLDFDAFTVQFMNMLVEGLEMQASKMKDAMLVEKLEMQAFKMKNALEDGEQAESDSGAGMLKYPEFEAALKQLLPKEEFTEQVAAEIFGAASEGRSEGEAEIDKCVRCMLIRGVFAPVLVDRDVATLKLADKVTGKLGLLLEHGSGRGEGKGKETKETKEEEE